MKAHFLAGCFITASVLSFPGQTQAESRDDWCSKYARIATAQFKEARGFNRCRRQDARWHDDELVHFKWCMRNPEDTALGEDRARRVHLASCKGGIVD